MEDDEIWRVNYKDMTDFKLFGSLALGQKHTFVIEEPLSRL